MDWDKLISARRLGARESGKAAVRGARSEFRRDYDRLVFSSPFRRLQNKTQVFPLPGSIFVHNRLTHSIEVASVGRSMADEIVQQLSVSHPQLATTLLSVPDIVAAACLAHDLGNPPFGHSGEKAIAAFFSEGPGKVLQDQLTESQWSDLVHFEGNANALRLLTHRFRGRRPGGFAMTYSTVASIIKYPYESALAGDGGKFGFFTTERETFLDIAQELGMVCLSQEPLKYARHPIVYIVEAADDICYEVMDIEDAHKLGWLTTQEVRELFLQFFPPERQQHMLEVMEAVDDPNEQVSYMRSSVIGCLVSGCAQAFIDQYDKIMSGSYSGTLIGALPQREREGYERCAAVSEKKIYVAGDVIDIDIAGTSIISYLMEKLVHAVLHPELNYSRMLLSRVPLQYETDAKDLFERIMAVVDHVSGMTDVYALDLYRKLNGTSLKINN